MHFYVSLLVHFFTLLSVVTCILRPYASHVTALIVFSIKIGITVVDLSIFDEGCEDICRLDASRRHDLIV